MDYETIVYGCNCCNSEGCYIDCHNELGWDRGEVTEIELPIFGGFTMDDGSFVSIVDFMIDSPTKSIKMVLKDHFGELVDTQEVKANSAEIEYHSDHLSCYYVVDKQLSDKLATGSYNLYVYIKNTLPYVNEKFPERTVFNKMVTKPSGLEITIY